MLKKRILSTVQYIFFLGIGVLLLWLGFRKLELDEVWTDIIEADYLWLMTALLFAIVSHIFRALRWNLLVNSLGYRTRLSSTFYSVMVGYLANTAVPRMGEFARCGVLSRKEKIPFNTLFGTVISERFFDLFVLLFILVLIILLQLDLVGAFVYRIFNPYLEKAFSNITSIILLVITVLLVTAGFIWLIFRIKERMKSFSFYQKARDFLAGIIHGIKTIFRMNQKWLFLFYTFAIWLCYIIMVYLPFKMLPETSMLNLMDGTTVMALGSLGIVAPVPGGIGAYHYITKVILTELYAVEANAAMSYATIVHAGQTFLNITLGALSYLMLGLYARKQNPLNAIPGSNKKQDIQR